MFQFQRNWSPLVLISRSSSFSVIQVIQTLRLSRKKESAFVVVVFISKRPGSYAIYRPNARVLKMQNFIPAYIRWCTYVRTYSVRTIFSEPKLRNFRCCFKVLEYRILYRSNIKDAPTFNVFKRLIKPFLRVRKDASSISDYLHIYICSENILISLKQYTSFFPYIFK